MDIEKWREWFPERVIGFDLADLTLAEWQYTPPDAYDQCQTWEGTWPGRTDKVSVVAAAYRGRPVYFQVLHPVIPTYAGTHAAEVPSRRELLLYIIIGVQVGAVALAWWNLRLGRGDRRGAFRLTVFIMSPTCSFGFWPPAT